MKKYRYTQALKNSSLSYESCSLDYLQRKTNYQSEVIIEELEPVDWSLIGVTETKVFDKLYTYTVLDKRYNSSRKIESFDELLRLVLQQERELAEMKGEENIKDKICGAIGLDNFMKDVVKRLEFLEDRVVYDD